MNNNNLGNLTTGYSQLLPDCRHTGMRCRLQSNLYLQPLRPVMIWDLLAAIIPAVILFLYGIENFSGEVRHIAGERFRNLF